MAAADEAGPRPTSPAAAPTPLPADANPRAFWRERLAAEREEAAAERGDGGGGAAGTMECHAETAGVGAAAAEGASMSAADETDPRYRTVAPSQSVSAAAHSDTVGAHTTNDTVESNFGGYDYVLRCFRGVSVQAASRRSIIIWRVMIYVRAHKEFDLLNV